MEFVRKTNMLSKIVKITYDDEHLVLIQSDSLYSNDEIASEYAKWGGFELEKIKCITIGYTLLEMTKN